MSMITQDWVGLVLVYLIIAIPLAVCLYLDKKGSSIDVRKVVHIGVGNFVFVWWMFTEGWIMLAFFTIPFALILFFAMFKGNIISKSKLGELSNEKGHRTGLFFYAITITILVLLCYPEHWVAASIGIVAMTYGDGFGSIIGKKFGKHPSINNKSIEGTLGVFLVTAIMSFIVITLYGILLADPGIIFFGAKIDAIVPPIVICLIAGAASAIIECVCPGEIDNLATPLLVTGLMVLLGL